MTDAIFCLALLIYSNAREEPAIAQLGVAQVALRQWGDQAKTLCEVVTAPGAFVLHRSPDYGSIAWATAETLATNTLRYDPPDVTGGAVFFTDAGEDCGEESAVAAPSRAEFKSLRLGNLNFWSKIK